MFQVRTADDFKLWLLKIKIFSESVAGFDRSSVCDECVGQEVQRHAADSKLGTVYQVFDESPCVYDSFEKLWSDYLRPTAQQYLGNLSFCLSRCFKSNTDLSLLKAAGYDVRGLIRAGYSRTDLKTAGFTAKELKAQGCKFTDARAAGFDLPSLKAAGYDARAFITAGCSRKDLQTAGFTAKELHSFGPFPFQVIFSADHAASDVQLSPEANPSTFSRANAPQSSYGWARSESGVDDQCGVVTWALHLDLADHRKDQCCGFMAGVASEEFSEYNEQVPKHSWFFTTLDMWADGKRSCSFVSKRLGQTAVVRFELDRDARVLKRTIGDETLELHGLPEKGTLYPIVGTWKNNQRISVGAPH